MPSKEVYIKRNKSFVHAQFNSEAAQEQLSLSRRSIGSYFYSQYSTRKGTGLNDEEIALLLPSILDVSPTDPEFKREVDKFYTEINTHIDAEGRKFEIGLKLDNSKPVTFKNEEGKYNLPINVEDYVRYRHAKSHPRCAGSPEEGKGDKTKWFYLEDPVKVMDATINSSEIADEALGVYMQMKEDADKMRMVITLLRHELPKRAEGQSPLIIDNLDPKEVLLQVREHLVLKKPGKFLKVATDEHLKRKYIVDELISIGLLVRIGNTIFIKESNDPLGVSLDDAAKVLWTPERSQTLSSLKTQFDEYKKRRTEKQLAKS